MNTELETPDTQPMIGAQIIPFKRPTKEDDGPSDEYDGGHPDFGDLWEWIAEFMEDVVEDENSRGRFTYWDVVYAMLHLVRDAIRDGNYSADGMRNNAPTSHDFADENLSGLLNTAILRLRELPVERHWIHRSEREVQS